MLNIQIDENEARELYLEKVKEKLKELEAELVFWDRNELMRRTCMSWSFILQEFFYDPRFPKYKVGKKWLFPATECREFLLTWLKEH